MKNIELFDHYAARILAELYEAFPVKRPLDARKLCGHSDVDEWGTILDERGERSKAFEVARGTIEWLSETGYLRGGDLGRYGLNGAVLTAMGLDVLKAKPESLRGADSMGDRLVRLVREGAFDLARDLVKSALASGAALAMRAVT